MKHLSLPTPSDFAAPPSLAVLAGWLDADRQARPTRLALLRERMARERIDALMLTTHADARYFAGICFGPNEEPTSGSSGWLLMTADALGLLVDSRYIIQAQREAPDAEHIDYGSDVGAAIATWLHNHGARQLGLDAQEVRHAVWERITVAAPGVELRSIRGWGRALRAVKEASEIERIAAACAVADRALAGILDQIRPGVTESALAWSLERAMREGGAEALAFDVAALAGGNAALPHGNPGTRELRAGEVILFDFGAQVAGYRSDMTRTLFVGEPSSKHAALYTSVHRGQAATIDLLRSAAEQGGPLPSGRACDDATRAAMAGSPHVYDHGLGHGIGLQTHELPSLSRGATDEALPSPTVFSVEPGIYVQDEIGIRIEDLVAVNTAAKSLTILTRFPAEPLIVG